jgi:hypothetical protein
VGIEVRGVEAGQLKRGEERKQIPKSKSRSFGSLRSLRMTDLWERYRFGPLVGIGFAGVDDADHVVGEKGVAAGKFDFGHVATDAVVLADRACLELS